MSVIGFDIGNENCVIAAAKRNGIDVLLNDQHKGESPALVSFGDKQRFFGSVGATFATQNPKSTISQIKRLIGRQYKEPSVKEELKLLPFETSEGPRGGILIELENREETEKFTPVEILGMLFKHLKQIAKKNLDSSVEDCVIGIPSYFTDLQRREYLDAATIAGLKPLMLMNDGTATALGYGMYKTVSDKGQTIVVFVDIGHCDTQVTVAAFEQKKMKILSHTFDPNLGGRDFDELLFKHFAAQFEQQYDIDVHSNDRACIRLRASCENLKRVLSVNKEAPLSIECLVGDKDLRGSMTRKEFEKLSEELLKRVTIPCHKAVRDTPIRLENIYAVELVGSGSRIPAIIKELHSYFKKEPTRTLNASECVARGCALRCAMLSPTRRVNQPYEIQDFFPYPIRLTIDEGQNKGDHEIASLPKGSPFPAKFRTPNRMTMPLHVQVFYTNKKDFPAIKSPKVGCFRISPPESSGKEAVNTEFEVHINTHGMVVINSAIMLDDGIVFNLQKKIGFNRTVKLLVSENLDYAEANHELHQAQKREQIMAKQDLKVEQIKIQRDTLQSFVYGTRNKLSSAYGKFATDTQKEGIMKSLQETEDWVKDQKSDDESLEQEYTVKLKDLKKLLDPIERRYEDDIPKEELMPLRQKDVVNNQNLEAEKQSIYYQQQESFKNSDLKHRRKGIRTSKLAWSPKHEPMDTDQSGAWRNELQDNTPMNSKNRGENVPEREKVKQVSGTRSGHTLGVGPKTYTQVEVNDLIKKEGKKISKRIVISFNKKLENILTQLAGKGIHLEKKTLIGENDEEYGESDDEEMEF